MHDSKSTAQPAAPQWDPPQRFTDPLVRRLCVERAFWVRTIRGRIPKIHDSAVALTLATYGNKDGTRCHPGVARLATDLFISEITVKRALSWLAENGWITHTERGARWQGRADVYRLTIPAPLAVEIGRWEGTKDGAQWMERPRGDPKRPGMRSRADPQRQGRQGSVSADIGICKDDSGIRTDESGISSDTPPEPLHQNLSHHSELLAPPRATARGQMPKIDPDDSDADEQIIDYVENVAGLAGTYTRNLVDGMLSEGRPIPAIINAAIDMVRNGDDSPF